MDEHLGGKNHFANIRNAAVNNLILQVFCICWVYLQNKFLERGFLG